MSDYKPRSLLQELQDYVPPKTYPIRLRTNGERIFSAINKLMNDIDQSCDEEMAKELKKRFFNAAKTEDFRKFERGIDKLEAKIRGK